MLRGVCTVCVTLLVTTLAGCVSDQQVIAQANDVHTQLEPQVVTDPELDAYVQEVGDKIIAAARGMYESGELEQFGVDASDWMFEDVQFHMVASPVTNAFTTGGRHVYMYTALFEGCATEDAFAAVVGHEFGHIIGRHVQNKMNTQYGLMAAAAGAGLLGAVLAEDGSRTETAATVGGLALVGGQVVGLQFGRDAEREADRLGFEFYIRAGYDPDQFDDFFAAMLEQQGGEAGGLQGFLSSHPQLSERIATAQGWAAEVDRSRLQRYQAPPIADGREFASLQQQSRPLTQQAAAASRSGSNTAATQALAILHSFPACVGGLSDGVVPEDQQ
ncbi:MAG: M48 family metalloprotease [Planctomycetota bacterium]